VKKMKHFCFLVLPLAVSLFGSTAYAQVHSRPGQSWQGSSLPVLKFEGSCSGGGQNVYLEHGASVRPTLIGVCEWLHSANTFSQKMKYYSGAPGGQPIRTLVGCQIPNGLEYRLAYYDMDDGFRPENRIFIDSNSSLVLLQSRNYFRVRNNHLTKAITVHYQLGNSQTIGTVPPQDDMSLIVSSVSGSEYTQPYRDADQARCD
jgi:hypothetical protein